MKIGKRIASDSFSLPNRYSKGGVCPVMDPITHLVYLPALVPRSNLFYRCFFAPVLIVSDLMSDYNDVCVCGTVPSAI